VVSDSRKPKSMARIPSAWFALKHGKSLSFWAAVYHVARARRIRKRDYVGVRGVADELELRLSRNRDIQEVFKTMRKEK
jgi:hypothetical protein